MRKSGLGLALLFSLIAPIKAVYAEAIMISGKLQADLPAVSFDPGPGDFVAYVNSNTITASGAGTACNEYTLPEHKVPPGAFTITVGLLLA